MPNETGMQLTEFRQLLSKVLQAPASVDGWNGLGGFVPTGGIILWSGATVPTGWYLCDGTNDTPDLTSKFVLGGALGSIGTTAAQVDAGISDHPSNFTGASDTNLGAATGAGFTAATSTHGHTTPLLSHTISTQYFPPYYTLAYIQKG